MPTAFLKKYMLAKFLAFGRMINFPRQIRERPFWQPVSSHFHLTFHSSAIEECIVNNHLFCFNIALDGQIPLKRPTLPSPYLGAVHKLCQRPKEGGGGLGNADIS